MCFYNVLLFLVSHMAVVASRDVATVEIQQ